MTRQSDATRQKGMALILVLWVMVLLIIMAGSFSLTMQRELSVVGNVRDKAQTLALAEAGIHYSVLMLLNPSEIDRWKSNASIYQVNFNDTQIRIRLMQESGKIDINKAEIPLLTTLMQAAGVEDIDEISRYVDAIMDWRDNDTLRRLNGAEEDEYQDAKLKYAPTNKPFSSIEDLQLVLGITPEMYKRLEPLVTVYSKQASIDPSEAPQSLLRGLPDIEESVVDDYLEQRVESIRNQVPVPAFPTTPGVQGGNSNIGVYTILSEAKLANGSVGKVKAVIKKELDPNGGPFQVLDWKQGNVLEGSLFNENNDKLVINSNDGQT
ncbi:MAG: type II secretion system protein GspK [Methylococcaceae bacterium]